MDGAGVQLHSRERPKGLSQTRAPSRLSNGGSATQQSSVQANRQYGSVASPSTPRAMLALPRESTPTSSYLQEKLQRGRKADGDRSSRMGSDMSGSTDSRPTVDYPVRATTSDGSRPRSSAGSAGASVIGEPGKKKGMGVKEMEQTVSTLHKQNFDLKLELYHRREKQSSLEQKIEALEAEKKEFEEMNDQLLAELEKRDKAVEEAVAMIVMLEEQLERVVKESETVRQIGLDSLFAVRPDLLDPPAKAGQSPKQPAPTKPKPDDVKVLSRMPSFLSERSDNTENLRNVYLGVRGSVLSLGRLPEGVDDGHPANHLTSPSLSVLSESSFMSVYGPKKTTRSYTPPNDDSPPETYSSGGPDARPTTRHNADIAMPLDRIVTPTRLPRSNSITRGTAPGQFHSINDILDQGSPLQRLERLERTYSLKADQSLSENERAMSLRTEGLKASRERELEPPRHNSLQSHKKSKDERREALRRVNTDALAIRHDQGLPPTPDTISTSTLRHYKDSRDNMSEDITAQRSFLALSEATTTTQDERSTSSHFKDGPVPQPPSMTAFNSRRDTATSSYFGSRSGLPPRPRSADETTVSHRRGNEWDTDSDFEDEMHSVASTDDIWLREGAVSNKQTGRRSPDLFSFPPGTGGWNTNDMFGQGAARDFGASVASKTNPIDDLMPAQGALFGTGPPPPPNRRSSLHARTGSSSATATLNQQPRRPEPANGRLRKSPERAKGHWRRSSDEPPPRPASYSHSQPPFQPPPADQKRGKDSHYPPIANQAPRQRGLNSFFRRSLGGGTGSAPGGAESAPTSATEPTFAAAGAKGGSVGTPSWIHRTQALDDDRTSVTPPPIMRNRGMGRRGSFDAEQGGASLGGPPSTPTGPPPMTPNTPNTVIAAAGPGVGPGSAGSLNKRKWLGGFGRSSGLRNRAV